MIVSRAILYLLKGDYTPVKSYEDLRDSECREVVVRTMQSKPARATRKTAFAAESPTPHYIVVSISFFIIST